MANIEYIKKTYGSELQTFEAEEDESIEVVVKVLELLPERYWRPDFGKTDNLSIQNTKKMIKKANDIFSIEYQRKKFPVYKRNEIRASLMLCDGMLKGETGTVLNNHPFLMYDFIRSLKANQLRHLNNNIIDSICKNILSHHTGWNGLVNMDDKTILDDTAAFVNLCAFLSSTEMEEKKEIPKEEKCISEIEALQIVSQMVSKQNWDGVVYTDTVFREHFIMINSIRITVPGQLLRAFYTIGQAIQGCD